MPYTEKPDRSSLEHFACTAINSTLLHNQPKHPILSSIKSHVGMFQEDQHWLWTALSRTMASIPICETPFPVILRSSVVVEA